MRKCQRLRLVAVLLLFVPPCAWLSAAPAPLPRPAKKEPAPQGVEAAYEKIRLGMTYKELFTLMAPFQEVPTGHGQWPCWTDGRFRVCVTIWVGGGPFGDIPEGVLEKSLCRKEGGGTQASWVPIKEAQAHP
jgi:hypothetical protein